MIFGKLQNWLWKKTKLNHFRPRIQWTNYEAQIAMIDEILFCLQCDSPNVIGPNEFNDCICGECGYSFDIDESFEKGV